MESRPQKKGAPFVLRKYGSIETDSMKNIAYLESHPKLLEGEWVVTEKVHGANFVIITDGKEFKCAKRSKLLKDGHDFYEWENTLDRYRNFILKLWALLQEQGRKFNELHIYGELYGGGYPYPDAKALTSRGKRYVQKGIWYAHTIEFFPYDLFLVGEDHGFLDFSVIEPLLISAGFVTSVRALARGIDF